MISKKSVIILSLFCVVALGVVSYFVILPVLSAYQFEVRVQSVSKPLDVNFRNLNKSTELPLLTNAGAARKTKKDNAESILNLIGDTREQLARIKSESESLSPMPYADLLGQYSDSYALRDRAKRFISQTGVALDEYEMLVNYLVEFHNAADNVTSELRSFNEVVDINIYGGQSEMIHLVADKIRSNATALSRAKPPAALEPMNEEMIVAITQAASGFDNLAYGLVIPADDPIYASARQIELATADIDRIMTTDYDKRITESTALKQVNDLGDKLELLSVR